MKPKYSSIENLIYILGAISFPILIGIIMIFLVCPEVLNTRLEAENAKDFNHLNTDTMDYLYLKRKEREPGHSSYKHLDSGVQINEDTVKCMVVMEMETPKANITFSKPI